MVAYVIINSIETLVAVMLLLIDWASNQLINFVVQIWRVVVLHSQAINTTFDYIIARVLSGQPHTSQKPILRFGQNCEGYMYYKFIAVY